MRASTSSDSCRTSTRARGDWGPTASGSFHATDCEAQVGECCGGGKCVIRCSAVTRETRPSSAGSARNGVLPGGAYWRSPRARARGTSGKTPGACAWRATLQC
jgi:hypothetical protein